MEKKAFRRGLLTGICASLVVLAGLLGGLFLFLKMSGDVLLTDPAALKKLVFLEELIGTNYIYETDEQDLQDGLFTGLYYGLGDPFSGYYSAKLYEKVGPGQDGSYTGIGAVMQMNEDDLIDVVSVYEGTGAAAAGILAGDVVCSVNGEPVTEGSLEALIDLLHSGSESEVTLGIDRDGESLSITAKVSTVQVPTVKAEMLSDTAGYLQITEFTGLTPEQFRESLAALKEAGMEKLIIDLRDNPGGYLDSVCEVLREILPKGLIVYTEDKAGRREEFTCDGKHALGLPLAVLVNGGSASASEVFAGAVRDTGIGTLIGERTYGKGIVQKVLELEDKSAVRITSAAYYTPSGKNIHGTGIEPDLTISEDEQSKKGRGDLLCDEPLRLAMGVLNEALPLGEEQKESAS